MRANLTVLLVLKCRSNELSDYDLVGLPKELTKVLASRLNEKNCLCFGTKITFYKVAENQSHLDILQRRKSCLLQFH